MSYQSEESVRLVVVGLVSIAAIALGAAAIDASYAGTTTADETVIFDNFEEIDGFGLNDTNNDSSGPNINDPGERGGGIVANLQTCIEPPAAWYGGLIYFGAFGGVVYVFKRLYSLGAAFLGMYAIAPAALTVYFFGTDCASTLGPSGPEGPNGPVGPGITKTLFSPEVSPLVVAGVLGFALVAGAAVLYRASGDQTVTVAAKDDESPVARPGVADLAAAAGKAADRLEKHNVDVDNEVYRAWWEMTSMLQVSDPETSSPGDFADAAVELGMDETDVGQLTEVFEEVRYGKRDPESREQRAIDAFRNIEAAYSNGEADAVREAGKNAGQDEDGSESGDR